MHMERSAVNKNRCIALKDWDRLCARENIVRLEVRGHLGFSTYVGYHINTLNCSGHLPLNFDLLWS